MLSSGPLYGGNQGGGISLHLPRLPANPHAGGSVRDKTQSGGIHFNDMIQQLGIDNLPFSGVGKSGCAWPS